ncbi:MAG: hypothetical protein QHC67_16235 [Sphingobium sp.]|uniref:hypothetical protein n=1 Tax=Sphingobium sp. TaxID=1912891 RepID=UPI0029AA296F|nr:hypothetical protein [Sphingobium sp.]MDX3911345.1 hypothetical protein [Sphingobium sp.]
MLSLYDRTRIENALALPLREDIKGRIRSILKDGLADLTHLLVITNEDNEAMVQEEVAFSPLENDGIRFGEQGFRPGWDWLHDHGGWFELVYCIGNSGFAFVLLVEDGEETSRLANLCQAYSAAPGKGQPEPR